MKLYKGVTYFTERGINSKRLCVCMGLIILSLIDIYAQRSEFSIGLELLTVDASDIHPSPSGGIEGDTVPVGLYFEFFVINHTNKPFLFGSNTRHYYRRNWDDSDCGEGGRFLMINGVDTIALFSRDRILDFKATEYPDTIFVWATIEEVEDSETHPVFVPFLRHWESMGENWLEPIYTYLKDSRFVYVPIQSDYQCALDKYRGKLATDSFIYPRDAIEIKKEDPFIIIINLSREEYYFYGPFGKRLPVKYSGT